MNIKPGECAACPCGEIPERLCIVEQGGKWALVAGNCCGDWHIEFRTGYHPLGSPELSALALAAWNAAPREGVAIQKQRAEHVPQSPILPQITPVLVYPPCSSSAEWVPPRPLGTC